MYFEIGLAHPMRGVGGAGGPMMQPHIISQPARVPQMGRGMPPPMGIGMGMPPNLPPMGMGLPHPMGIQPPQQFMRPPQQQQPQ